MPHTAYPRKMFLVFICFFCLLIPFVSTTIIGAFVHPHGGIALDPRYFNTTNQTAKEEAWEIHDACKRVGKMIYDLSPDLIFLSTPHGIADNNNFAIYLNPNGSGYADTDNCACPPCCYNVSVRMNSRIAQEIVSIFGYEKNVTGFSGYGPPGKSDEPFPLRWGEVIPLYFVHHGRMDRTEVVIVSQPSRRYTEDVAMIPELLRLGSSLYSYFQSLDVRVLILISADLAHTHSKDGPYGYSNASEPFDLAVGKWAKYLDEKSLVVDAASYVDKALSCGYTGLVMLHGLLSAGGLSSWQPKLLVNHHPSYYGMMVASFLKKELVTVFD